MSSAAPQPERERLLEEMVEAMERVATEQVGGQDPRGWGPPPMRELADAALRSLEAPNHSVDEEITPCSCGHSGYSKDGPHKPGCPLA